MLEMTMEGSPQLFGVEDPIELGGPETIRTCFGRVGVSAQLGGRFSGVCIRTVFDRCP
jgi:hypothetical protein